MKACVIIVCIHWVCSDLFTCWVAMCAVGTHYTVYLAHLQILLLLGGYGKSPDSEALKTDQNRVDLLSRFMESLGVRTAVLLSPSMSGHYSIPFLMKNSDQLHGFIPIAPVGTRSYTPQQYQNIKVSGGKGCDD